MKAQSKEKLESLMLKMTSSISRLNAVKYQPKLTDTERCMGLLVLLVNLDITHDVFLKETERYSNRVIKSAMNQLKGTYTFPEFN